MQYPNVHVETYVADVSNENDVKAYIDLAKATFGRIERLYNNVGIEGKQAPLTEYDLTVFKKVVDINLLEVYYGMRYVNPLIPGARIWPDHKCCFGRRYSRVGQSGALCCHETSRFWPDQKCSDRVRKRQYTN
ncbi:SDR family oxidoreductase [Sphingobacterium suaedae]|uniref:SDR family oxidoreductase n=1 Tax=Sphingobacterium suaedae TaxID=1686402 RepID=A0ABW5KD56_9SPHI